MNRFLLIALCPLIFSPTSSLANDDRDKCYEPKPPSIPSGRRAREEKMTTAMDQAKSFLADNQAFRECIGKKFELIKSGSLRVEESAIQALQRLIDESHEMDTFVAEMLNREVRIFNSTKD